MTNTLIDDCGNPTTQEERTACAIKDAVRDIQLQAQDLLAQVSRHVPEWVVQHLIDLTDLCDIAAQLTQDNWEDTAR